VRHAGIAFDRAERVQRSEGVRLVVHVDGGLRPARRYASGNAPVADGIPTEVLDTVADRAVLVDEHAADRVDTAERLDRCFDGIEPSDRRLLELADGHGYTVTELAELYGNRRETLSRRINRTRRRVLQNGTSMATIGQA
jgi:RNA polymerase sigma factor (sigma-70 family)